MTKKNEKFLIADEDVFNIWKCSKCRKIEEVHPDGYRYGIPMCSDCDVEMTYKETKIKVSDSLKLLISLKK